MSDTLSPREPLIPFAFNRAPGAATALLVDWSEADTRPGVLYECPHCKTPVKVSELNDRFGFEHLLGQCSQAMVTSLMAALNQRFSQGYGIRVPELIARTQYVSSHDIFYEDSRSIQPSQMESVVQNLGPYQGFSLTQPVWHLKVGPLSTDLLFVLSLDEPVPETALWEFKRAGLAAVELVVPNELDLTFETLDDLLAGQSECIRWVHNAKLLKAQEQMASALIQISEKRESQLFVPENGHVNKQLNSARFEQLSALREAEPLYQAIRDLTDSGKLGYFLQTIGVPEDTLVPTWADAPVEDENCFGTPPFVWQAALMCKFVDKAKEREMPDYLVASGVATWLTALFGCPSAQAKADERAVTAYLAFLADQGIVKQYGNRFYIRKRFLAKLP